MDQAIRNKLRGVVTQCRRLLEDSVRQELQGKFGIYAVKKDDVQVDDERLEGVGVAPTIEVQADPASMGLGDPQLDRAIAVLSGA